MESSSSVARKQQQERTRQPLHLEDAALRLPAKKASSGSGSRPRRTRPSSSAAAAAAPLNNSRAEPLLTQTQQQQEPQAADHCCCSSVMPNNRLPRALQHWLVTSAWPGLGLFGESYVLFSIGTLKPMWAILFPDCWQGGGGGEEDLSSCRDRLLHSITYSVVLGVITGMVAVGYAASSLGRRRGSITTAAFMASAACGLTLSSILFVDDAVRLFRSMSIFLFLFGVGVGGEYPLAASSASEAAMGEMRGKMKLELEREEQGGLLVEPDGVLRVNPEEEGGGGGGGAEEVPEENNQKYRGRQIQLVFTMQGMGIFVNSLSITLLMLMTGQTGDEYENGALLFIWRAVYVFGTVTLLFVLASRWRHLKESKVWQDDRRRREQLARNTLQDTMATTSGVLSSSQAALAYPNTTNNSGAASPMIHAVSSNHSVFSGVSDVSSLSAPSVEVGRMHVIKEVPSTDPEEDIQTNDMNLLLRNYGVRLVGVSLSWMFWDVAFYGNKLFQSSFLLALTGEQTTLFQLALAASLNSFVALLGYFGAAAIVDHPLVGRCRLQQVGFLLTGSLFVGCGFLYNSLSPTVLVIMYLGSSFFGQLGPNATTFLIPAEIFPTEMRTFCHGVAAASGKVGALLAAVMFNHVNDLDMFLLSGYASFAACAITFWTIPETRGLDLYEIDRKWRMILDGRKGEYEGEANNPRFLSYYERNKLSFQQHPKHMNSSLDVSF